MEFNLQEESNGKVLFLSGDIDLHCSQELRTLIISELKSSSSLEINLKEVTYLDSSGVACFVEAYQISKKKSLDFCLSNLSDAALQVIKLARLDTVFPIK